ncbi:hypothetical protein HG531_000872 [Fusarium graminearum]|nr:hypothetical protein HG531_000872 [Fusarium graminearum]
MLLCFGIQTGVLMRRVPTSVLATQVNGHEDRQDQGHDLEAQEGSKAWEISWSIFGQEQIRCNHTTNVTAAHIHRNTDTTLERSPDVVAIPGDALWNTRKCA